MKLCMMEISTDGLAHIPKPILHEQAAKPSVDLCNDAGAFIDEGGVDLHQRGAEAKFAVGIRCGEDTTGADDDVTLAVHPRGYTGVI